MTSLIALFARELVQLRLISIQASHDDVNVFD
jgi:hypothetical protein